MKTQRFKLGRLQSTIVGAVAFAGVTGLGAIANAAVAPAASSITNQASVTYEDSAGNPLSALSNNASVTVAQIYASTIGSDNLATVGAPGSTVNFAHTITNNGNGSETYHIILAQGGGDSGDFNNIEVRQDGGVNCAGANGQTDAGEAILTTFAGAAGPSTEVATVTIAAGQTACIAVAAQIPAGALATDTYNLTVEAQAEQGTGAGVATSVGDITDGDGAIGGGANGDDGLDGTNNDRVTVVADAILEVTKSATPDFANRRITYDILVRNTGSAVARDVVVFDGLPANTTLVAASVSGSGFAQANDYVEPTAFDISESAIETQLIAQVANFTAAGDVLVDLNGDGDETDADEASLGYDLNRNGNTTDGTVQGVFAFDDELAPGANVSIQFVVEYASSLAAGYVINNRAHVSGDSNNDGDTQDAGETPETGDIPVTVPQTFAVDVNEGAGDIDGDQADGSDTQTIATGAEGGVAILNNVLTNQGNGIDRLELNAINDGGAAFFTAGGTDPAAPAQTGGTACVAATPRLFPAGTTFTYWNVTTLPAVQLVDTNSAGGVDTGPMTAGQVMNIEVRAALPAGTNGLGDYCASMQVTSAGDSAVVDYKLERLGEIVAPAVDLANDGDFTVDVPNASHDAGGTNADVHNTGDIQSIVTQNATPGQTITFDLFVQNEGLVAESYNLGFGGQWNNAITAGLPAGWTVTFDGADTGAGAITTGSNITSTGLVPPGGITQITANVTVPAAASATTANYVSDSDGDAANETIDGGLTGSGAAADGDGDYPVFFTITGTSSGAVDVVLNAVDVAEVENITVTADQTGQVEQGGTIVYPHVVSNLGNTTETVQLTSTDTHPDFDPSVIRVDTDGDGTVDNVVFAPGVVITLPSGNVTVGGTPAAPTIVLQPGDTFAISTTVVAQTDAPLGNVNTTTVTATYDVGTDNDTATATDTTTVVTVQVSSTKTAARDQACDGTPDEAFTETGATATAPGECVIWQIIVDNSGTRDAFRTAVTDNLSTFTEFQAGSLESCSAETTLAATALNTLCTAAGGTYCSHTDAVDNEAGCASGFDADGTTNLVHYYIGGDNAATGAVTEPDGSVPEGGVLGAGQKVTVRFRVQLSTN